MDDTNRREYPTSPGLTWTLTIKALVATPPPPPKGRVIAAGQSVVPPRESRKLCPTAPHNNQGEPRLHTIGESPTYYQIVIVGPDVVIELCGPKLLGRRGPS